MKGNPKDPFSVKSYSKLHPVRLFYTAWARFEEWRSIRQFRNFELPLRPTDAKERFPFDLDFYNTAVTPEQMRTLLAGVLATNELSAPVVEVGSFRGVSTQAIASSTSRCVFAVDPYAGYGGAEDDYLAFRERTRGLKNVSHHRETSGQASANPSLTTVSFAFIDAVHDYVNAKFDGVTWSRKLVQNGMIAFHDTDSSCFPGVARAVWELLNDSDGSLLLHFHVPGLVILRRA